MKIQALLPALVLLLILAAPNLGHESGCGATYCVSIRENVSAASGGTITRPELAVFSIVQVITVAVIVSQLGMALKGLGNVIPLAFLSALTHVKNLESSRSFRRARGAVTFWLPIESISAGRITSRMLRASNFFGPGRRCGLGFNRASPRGTEVSPAEFLAVRTGVSRN